MAKILSDRQIKRLLTVVDDDTTSLSESLKPNTKFEKKLLLAIDERFASIQNELKSLSEGLEELETQILGIEERIESIGASYDPRLKKEFSEIKEMLRAIKLDTKYLKIQKAATEAAPEYKNEQLNSENEVLKAELERLRADMERGKSDE